MDKHKEFIRDVIYTQVDSKIEFYPFCNLFIDYSVKNKLHYDDIHKILDDLVKDGFIRYETETYINYFGDRVSNLFIVLQEIA